MNLNYDIDWTCKGFTPLCFIKLFQALNITRKTSLYLIKVQNTTRVINDNSDVRKLGYENLKVIKCTLHL